MLNSNIKISSFFTKPNLRLILRKALIIFFIFCFLLYINEKNNTKRVYLNLSTVLVGEDVQTAIKKMKHCTFLLEYKDEPCSNSSNNNVYTHEIIFKHKDPNDYPNDYLRLYYDIRTNRITGKWLGNIGS